MANTRETVTQTYEGESIQCAKIVVNDTADLKLPGICPINDSYIFQLVAKADAARTITVKVGNLTDTITLSTTFVRYVVPFSSVNVTTSNDVYVTFPNGTYYLYNLQLERAINSSGWRPAPEDAEDYADKAASDAVNGQTQQDIFNKLTNNGAVQGITLSNGQLYINASYIQSGTLVLGGVNNGNGQLKVVDASDQTVGTWTKDGINLIAGTVGGWTIGSNRLYKEEYSGVNLSAEVGMETAFGDVRVYSKKYDSGGSSDYIESNLRFGNIQLQRYETGVGVKRDAGQIGPSTTLYSTLDGFPELYVSGAKALSLDVNSSTIVFYQTNLNSVAHRGYNAKVLYLKPTSGVTVQSSFTVTGTKSRSANAGEYSNRLLYCYETPSPMFGDVGEGEISEDGRAYIWLDPIFANTITTSNYQVFLQAYGEGQAWIAERHPDHFIVEGTQGLSFGWELKGKQADFDQLRLEKEGASFTTSEPEYGEMAAEYIQELHQGRIPA